MLGTAVADEGDFERARQLFADSAAIFGELGDEHNTLLAARMLAWMYHELGDVDRARSLHEENLARARTLRDDSIVATTLGALGEYAVDDGRFQEAIPMLKESLRINEDLGNPRGIATQLCRFAGALAFTGRPESATRLLSCSEALLQELGVAIQPWLARWNEKIVDAIRSELAEAAFAEAWEQGRTLTAEAALALVHQSVD